jgi:hypothetical protein
LEDITEFDGGQKAIEFRINPNLHFLSQAEKDQIQYLVQLGAMFK